MLAPVGPRPNELEDSRGGLYPGVDADRLLKREREREYNLEYF